jgi:hypothetical protein
MDTPIPEDKLEPIKQALFQGRKIQAIKRYRKRTETGLKEAKKAVEKLEIELRAASPEKFTAPTGGKGCLGVMVALGAVVLLIVLWVASLFFDH